MKCIGYLGFTIKPDGCFIDHRGIEFHINRVGKDIIALVIKNAGNYVVSEKLKTRKEWAYIADHNLTVDVERTTRSIAKMSPPKQKILVSYMSGAFQTPEG